MQLYFISTYCLFYFQFILCFIFFLCSLASYVVIAENNYVVLIISFVNNMHLQVCLFVYVSLSLSLSLCYRMPLLVTLIQIQILHALAMCARTRQVAYILATYEIDLNISSGTTRF